MQRVGIVANSPKVPRLIPEHTPPTSSDSSGPLELVMTVVAHRFALEVPDPSRILVSVTCRSHSCWSQEQENVVQ